MIIVEDFMATGVQTLSERHSLSDASAMMEKYACYHLPVVNEKQQLVGLVTHRDLQKALPSPFFPQANSSLSADAICVSEIMHRDLITVTPDTELRQAAMYLGNQRIGCLPVIKSGRLVGIITNSDFVAVAVELLAEMEYLDPIAI